MRESSRDRITDWWADLFGCERALLWQGLSVTPHLGLGDYQGIFVAHRPTSCHVSLPSWVGPDLRESLNRQGIRQLGSPMFWHRLPETTGLTVLGPSMHSYTDTAPGTDTETAADIEVADLAELNSLKPLVAVDDWNEGGFGDDVHTAFVLRETSGEILAAANLTEFLGHPADVGVVVRPGFRGRGLGTMVARVATSYAVRHGGIARWRARIDNTGSRRAAAALGFEDYCHQLAIRA